MVMSSPIWSDSPCKYQHIDVRVDGDWRRPLRSWGMSKWRETPAKRTRSAHPWDGKFMPKADIAIQNEDAQDDVDWAVASIYCQISFHGGSGFCFRSVEKPPR